MQETDFIDQNKEKWEEFESILNQSSKDPNRITNLFIETTDDLSYSQTYYPNRSVRVYLNGIAQQLYQTVYTNKRRERNAFIRFWTNDLPDVMWYARKQLLVAFLVFAGALFIGVMSSIYYPEFPSIMLGEDYVEITKENIEKGDPMAIYKSGDALESFVQIAINNITISFRVFVLGVTFGVLTYFFLLYNGVMVGAFVYFFIARDLAKESLLAIMLHGTLELSMIVLSGCAGLYLAKGLVFPGTYRRIDAMLITARGAIKIMVAVALFLLYAAFVESFGTRFTSFDGTNQSQFVIDFTRAIFIIISLAMVLGYFVLLPYLRYKRGAIKPLDFEELPPSQPYVFQTREIKSPSRIFMESFRLFGIHSKQILSLSAVIALAFMLVFVWATLGNVGQVLEAESRLLKAQPVRAIWSWNVFDAVFDFKRFPQVLLVFCLAFYAWLIFLTRTIARTMRMELNKVKWYEPLYLILPVFFSILIPPGWRFFVLVVLGSIGALWYANSVLVEKLNPGTSAKRFEISKFTGLLTVIGMFLLLQTFALYSLNAQVMSLVVNVVSINVPTTWISASNLNGCLYVFFMFFVLSTLLALTFYSVALHAFHAHEIASASALHQQIDNIGKKKRAYGLEME